MDGYIPYFYAVIKVIKLSALYALGYLVFSPLCSFSTSCKETSPCSLLKGCVSLVQTSMQRTFYFLKEHISIPIKEMKAFQENPCEKSKIIEE